MISSTDLNLTHRYLIGNGKKTKAISKCTYRCQYVEYYKRNHENHVVGTLEWHHSTHLKKTGQFIEESRFSKNSLQLWNTAYLNIELQPLTLVLLSSSNSFCN